MQKLLTLVIAFLLTPGMSGCLEPEDKRTVVEGPSIFDFGRLNPTTTWYHYAGTLSMPYAVDATNDSAIIGANISVDLTGNNICLILQMQHIMALGLIHLNQL